MVEDCFGIFLSFYIYCFLKQIRTWAGYYKEKSKYKINQILVALDNLEHFIILHLVRRCAYRSSSTNGAWGDRTETPILLYNISVTAANLHQCLISDYTLCVPLLKEQFLKPNLSWGKIYRTQYHSLSCF